ncbi:MAG TPA: amidohydrolase [Roseiarcus sp.]|jgi:predicted TIM-barrel fold metal-dependent hydrolase|nr:amidohydrolase [Roseiarcus sp.]
MQTPIIDTHLHLIYREKLSYPWLSDVAPLNRDFSYETYAVEARRCGVTDALHMEVDVAPGDIEAETRNVEDLAGRPQSLLRGAISACRPEDDGFPAFLDRQRADPFVKGFRRVLHVVPDGLSEGATFRANIRRLAGASLPFDLCVRPDQIDKAIALADVAPSVQFVLDHCGVPAIKDRAEHPWREHIAEIARRPNVAVKISGVVAYADPASWTVDDIRPYVEHAIESFGWDRVVWGSDWPVCTLTASLSIWVAAAQAITLGSSADERARLFSLNARRIWRLPG